MDLVEKIRYISYIFNIFIVDSIGKRTNIVFFFFSHPFFRGMLASYQFFFCYKVRVFRFISLMHFYFALNFRRLCSRIAQTEPSNSL